MTARSNPSLVRSRSVRGEISRSHRLQKVVVAYTHDRRLGSVRRRTQRWNGRIDFYSSFFVLERRPFLLLGSFRALTAGFYSDLWPPSLPHSAGCCMKI